MASYPKGIPVDTPLGKPNCGVISVAMICGITHEEAWDALRRLQPKGSAGRWQGRTYDVDRYKVMEEHGVKFDRLQWLGGNLKHWLSSSQFQRSGTYEVCITGHAMVLHRGRFFDQNQGKDGLPMRFSPYMRRRMSSVVRILSGSPLVD